ncbi:MAG: anti-sigma factor [Actinobacteria bacterium]|nr:anti-sigma factor [Actinomycetota bacterium]
MEIRRTELHGLVGAYVLDAVAEADRFEFERHLLTCEQCREDVRGLREASSRLAAAAAITPRPALREPTLRAAALIRQVPPVVDAERVAKLNRGRAIVRRVVARRWVAGTAAGLAAVLAIAAVLLGVHAGSMRQSLLTQQQHDRAMTAVLGAHDAVAMTAKVSTGGTATVVMSHRARALVFTGNGLARLRGAKAYELWLAGPDGVRPAGMLPAGRHGMSGPTVVGGLKSGQQILMTVEPASGSRLPTSAPVVSLPLGA